MVRTRKASRDGRSMKLSFVFVENIGKIEEKKKSNKVILAHADRADPCVSVHEFGPGDLWAVL